MADQVVRAGVPHDVQVRLQVGRLELRSRAVGGHLVRRPAVQGTDGTRVPVVAASSIGRGTVKGERSTAAELLSRVLRHSTRNRSYAV